MNRKKAECVHCSKQISLSNLDKHQKACVKTKPPKKIRGVDFDPNRGYKDGTRVGKNQYTKAKELGLAKPLVTDETRKKISVFISQRNLNEKEESKEKRKNTIKQKIMDGQWHVSLAKKMHHNYQGVDLHGTWELYYAKFLDKNKIEWERCKEVFSYTFDGQIKNYTPDFFLVESKEYVEIKGYVTEKDVAKWKQFPKDLTLKVLKRKDLKDLNII